MSAHLELEALSALLDGELEHGAAGAARRHLETCAECAERYAGMQRSVATLRGLGAAAPPPEILHRIRRQAATIPANPGLLERLGDWLHPPALRPAFAAAFSLVFAAVLAVYGVNAYYSRQSAPARTAADQPLEAFLRSGVPPGPSGQRASSDGDAKAKDLGPGELSEKDKQEMRSLGYLSPGGSDGAAKKGAAVAAPRRPAAPPPAAAPRMPAASTTSRDRLAGNVARDAAAEAESAPQASAEVGAAAPAPEELKAAAVEPRSEPEAPAKLQKERAEETAASAGAREQAKPVPTPAPAAPPAVGLARQDAPARRVAGRLFTEVGAIWIEQGIPLDASRSRLDADSPAGRALVGRLPELRLLLRDTGVVVLRDGDAVVELRSSRLPRP